MKKIIILIVSVCCVQCNAVNTEKTSDSYLNLEKYDYYLQEYCKTRNTEFLDSVDYILDLELQKCNYSDLLWCTRKVSTLILMNKFSDAILFVENISPNVYLPMGAFYQETLLLRLKAMDAYNNNNIVMKNLYLRKALNLVYIYIERQEEEIKLFFDRCQNYSELYKGNYWIAFCQYSFYSGLLNGFDLLPPLIEKYINLYPDFQPFFNDITLYCGQDLMKFNGV